MSTLEWETMVLWRGLRGGGPDGGGGYNYGGCWHTSTLPIPKYFPFPVYLNFTYGTSECLCRKSFVMCKPGDNYNST